MRTSTNMKRSRVMVNICETMHCIHIPYLRDTCFRKISVAQAFSNNSGSRLIK